MSDPKVVVLGDVMVDEYVYCHVNRISPEAPVAVAEPHLKQRTPGGAANLAVNLLNLRCPLTAVIGAIGNDDAGAFLMNTFKGGVGCWLPCGDTIVKQRIVSDKKHLLRVDYNDKITLALKNEDFDLLRTAAADADFLVVSDYGKGTVKPAVYDAVKRAAKPEARIFIDPYPEMAHMYWERWLLKCNQKEHEAIQRHMGAEFPKYLNNTPYYVRTLGADGASLNRADRLNGSRHTTTYNHVGSVNVHDVTGAGDVFMAVLVKAVVDGFLVDDAMAVANQCAAKSVQRFGTGTIYFEDYVEACGRMDLPTAMCGVL